METAPYVKKYELSARTFTAMGEVLLIKTGQALMEKAIEFTQNTSRINNFLTKIKEGNRERLNARSLELQREHTRYGILKALNLALEKFWNIKYIENSKKNISRIRKQLENNPDSNIVLYFNHISLLDGLLADKKSFTT